MRKVQSRRLSTIYSPGKLGCGTLNVSLSSGVITGGNVNVGENSYIGIGATIKNGIKIGKNTIIGGNSYVNKNCTDNSIYFGVPAKLIKKNRKRENVL